jgi:4-hydroxybenzoate polyprenyltransferase
MKVLRARDLVRLLRPHQWVKNGFVLAGVVFGHGWEDPHTIVLALSAFVAFCLASSAVYAFNDCIDAEQDRGHPDKRTRPVARGAISVAEGLTLAVLLALLGLAAASLTSLGVAASVVGYLALNAAYTLGLKHVPVIDVLALASGFMLRLLAGTAGIGIVPSNWLLACGMLLTLFLGFAKRRAELERLAGDAGQHRAVLASYSPRFLDGAITVCAIGMIVAYVFYTLAPETAELHGTSRLVLTVPWVLLGTLRYLFRLRYRGGAVAHCMSFSA